MNADQPYAVKGSSVSEQAEASSANNIASQIQMRILVELQVLTTLLANNLGTSEDLRQMRQNVADSIT